MFRTIKFVPIVLLCVTSLFAQGGQPTTVVVESGTIELVQSSKSYDLGITPQAGTYTVRFFVKNHFGPYPGHYEAQLDIGTKELCPTYGWGPYSFTETVLVCHVSNYITTYSGFGYDPSQHLFLVLSEDGPDYWGVKITDVSYTFTPTP